VTNRGKGILQSKDLISLLCGVIENKLLQYKCWIFYFFFLGERAGSC